MVWIKSGSVVSCRNLPDYIGMAELFKQGDLSDSGGRDAFIFCFEADTLQGDDLSRHAVLRFVHNTVSSFPYLF